MLAARLTEAGCLFVRGLPDRTSIAEIQRQVVDALVARGFALERRRPLLDALRVKAMRSA